jgi:hypothetical protein
MTDAVMFDPQGRNILRQQYIKRIFLLCVSSGYQSKHGYV